MAVKKIAEKNGTSVSEMVTDFFRVVSKPKRKKNVVDLIEELDKPSIKNVDLIESYYEEQRGKYGF